MKTIVRSYALTGMFAGALILPLAAEAQPEAGASTVTIRLAAEECARVPNEISVVLNGRDGEDAFPAYRKTGTDVWIGRSDQPFDPATSYASLRLGVARTDCIPTVADDGQARLLFFECKRRPIRSVTIDANPATFVVRYVREVPKNPDNRWSIPCTEHALLPPGKGAVELVQFPNERLRLQLAWKEPAERSSGREPPGLIVNHPSVIKDAEKEGTKTRTLRPDLILEAYRAQRAEGLLDTRPSASSNASEDDRLRLTAAGLTSLVVTVK